MKNPTSVDLIKLIFKDVDSLSLCLAQFSKIIKRFCIIFNVVVLLLARGAKKAFFDCFV